MDSQGSKWVYVDSILLTNQTKNGTIILLRVINEMCVQHVRGKFCHFTHGYIN